MNRNPGRHLLANHKTVLGLIMKKNILHRYLFFIFITVLSLQGNTAYAADIQVKVDRNIIEMNETFTLLFEANSSVDDDPDFSPLEKDFQILGTSTSSNISIINGNYQKTTRWNVSLMPLHEGLITIPSINFGSDRSPQHQVKVNPVRTSSAGDNAEFISELSISTQSTFPQAQVIVTQRMLSSRNINGYEFSKLKTSGVDAAIQPLGELKQYQTQRGSTPYLVLEQRYVLYPQAAGKLTLEPSIASARLSLNNRSGYDPFAGNTKTVRRASEQRSITVNPVPDAFNGAHWLPAIEVQLVEDFPENKKFKVGEPITRTLSLLVDGQSASQLPEFVIPEINGLKQYPDKPVLNDTPSTSEPNAGITGAQQIKVAIIPSQAGSFTLPEIRIPWWNISSGKLAVAKIPARTFKVEPAVAGSIAVAPPATINTQPAPVVAEENNVPAAVATEPVMQPDAGSALLWQIISLLLLFALLVTLFMLWRSKRSLQAAEKIPAPSNPSLKQSYKLLGRACLENDAKLCKDALLIWAQAAFIDAPVYSLGELIERVNPPLAEKINLLNMALYKNQQDSWQCDGLLELCKEFEQENLNKNSTPDKNQLESLYR